MFFALVFVIWAWAYSLQDQQSFEYVKELMTSIFAKIIAWGTISLLTYHIVGGIRHMIMDLGHWEELRSGDISAKLSIALWAVLSVLAGVWLWF
ncbi:succinate dehydrogenase, cytochrome b556 subunit [Rheinheimera salexigens]|uniref:Succinate dehydrogenase cytochrome b556 subunit n=2 Tax=Rheinheimera salexigens TaxID=1628148 RepID=A0A1E7Q5T6_9GAMM|nr:succinate dehydrogenase, cytochrome b556 subunit [Rheinheimera salexigens]